MTVQNHKIKPHESIELNNLPQGILFSEARNEDNMIIERQLIVVTKK